MIETDKSGEDYNKFQSAVEHSSHVEQKLELKSELEESASAERNELKEQEQEVVRFPIIDGTRYRVVMLLDPKEQMDQAEEELQEAQLDSEIRRVGVVERELNECRPPTVWTTRPGCGTRSGGLCLGPNMGCPAGFTGRWTPGNPCVVQWFVVYSL